MKKTLMAGTALVAGSMLLAAAPVSAAEKIKLGLGGYMEQWFGYADEDKAYTDISGGANNLDQKSDSEIYIKGETTLDNGLKFGVKWEIEGDGDATSSASGQTGGGEDNTGRFDEAMIFVSGSFGRINIGQEDTASELMGYGAPAVGPVGVNKSDAGDWIRDPVASVNITHNMDMGLSDKHNISYYTPRVAGFQAGASYHPVGNENSDATQSETAFTHNGYSAAVNYVNKFDQVSVAVYGGFASIEAKDATAVANTTPTEYQGDDVGYAFGANIGFGGFTVGGAYLNENSATTRTTWDVGVQYKAGMNAFSVAYISAKTEINGQADDNKGQIIAAGYERTLGPGVTWGSSIAHANWDGGAGDTGSFDNDGIIVVTGIKLDF
jgi:hypothetical protein